MGILSKIGLKKYQDTWEEVSREQFDAEDTAKLEMIFAGHTFEIEYENESRLEYGEYEVGKAVVDNVYLEIVDGKAVLKRDIIDKLQGQNHKITATLIRK